MKTMIFKNGIFAMLMLAFVLVVLPSCDKEEETRIRLSRSRS